MYLKNLKQFKRTFICIYKILNIFNIFNDVIS